ncbi:MAG: hypothetical protein Q8R79_00255 [Legionellaceae bacterium]|nr:hypothetical protein [Legionellaceae bacterium]
MPSIVPLSRFSTSPTLQRSSEYPYEVMLQSSTDPSKTLVHAIIKTEVKEGEDCVAQVERFSTLDGKDVYVYQEGIFTCVVEKDNSVDLIVKEGMSEVYVDGVFECRSRVLVVDVAQEHKDALQSHPPISIGTMLVKYSPSKKIPIITDTSYGGVHIETIGASGMLMMDAIYWNGYFLGGTILQYNNSEILRLRDIPLSSRFPMQYSGKIEYFYPEKLIREEKSFQTIKRKSFFELQTSQTGEMQNSSYNNIHPLSWEGGELICSFKGILENGVVVSGVGKQFKVDTRTGIKYSIEDQGETLNNVDFLPKGYTIKVTQIFSEQKQRVSTTVLHKDIRGLKKNSASVAYKASESSVLIENGQKSQFETRQGTFQSTTEFIEPRLIDGTRKSWVGSTTTTYTLEEGQHNDAAQCWTGTITHRTGDTYEIYIGQASTDREEKAYEDVNGTLLTIQPITQSNNPDPTVKPDIQGDFRQGFKNGNAITEDSYHFTCGNKRLITLEGHFKEKKVWSATQKNGNLTLERPLPALKKKELERLQEKASAIYDKIEEILIRLGYIDFNVESLDLKPQKKSTKVESSHKQQKSTQKAGSAHKDSKEAKQRAVLGSKEVQPASSSEAASAVAVSSPPLMSAEAGERDSKITIRTYDYETAQQGITCIERWNNYAHQFEESRALSKIMVLKYHALDNKEVEPSSVARDAVRIGPITISQCFLRQGVCLKKNEYAVQGIISDRFLRKGARFQGYVRCDIFNATSHKLLKSISYEGAFFCEEDLQTECKGMTSEFLEGTSTEIDIRKKTVSKMLCRMEGLGTTIEKGASTTLIEWGKQANRDVVEEAGQILRDPLQFYDDLAPEIKLTQRTSRHRGAFFSVEAPAALPITREEILRAEQTDSSCFVFE